MTFVERVLFAGTWDEGAGYPRTRALRNGLRERGVEVREVRVPLPDPRTSRTKFLRSFWRWPGFAIRLWRTRSKLRRLVRRAVREFDPQVVVVPYPGHLAVRWITGLVDVPVVLDMFLSLHGTAVEDRQLFRPGSWGAKLFAAIDRRAVEAADLALLDTPGHADYVRELVGDSAAPVDWVAIADPEAPADAKPSVVGSGPLEVLFFGTGVPLHGLRVLCDAVAATDSARLTLVGGTPEDREHALASIPPERLDLGDEFESRDRIDARLDKAEVVAGIFGASHKASIVVPFKIVHAFAAGRPVLTADTPAVREFLHPGADCFVCPRDDPAALAAQLAELAEHRGELARVGAAARSTFEESFSVGATGARLHDVLDRVYANSTVLEVDL